MNYDHELGDLREADLYALSRDEPERPRIAAGRPR